MLREQFSFSVDGRLTDILGIDIIFKRYMTECQRKESGEFCGAQRYIHSLSRNL